MFSFHVSSFKYSSFRFVYTALIGTCAYIKKVILYIPSTTCLISDRIILYRKFFQVFKHEELRSRETFQVTEGVRSGLTDKTQQ